MGLRPGSRLAWFAFWVDDWIGGTMQLSIPEQGAYFHLLCVQWSSKDLRAIPDDQKQLDRMTEGYFTARVREKFQSIELDGAKFLRNERLAAEWTYAKGSQEHGAKAADARWHAQTMPDECSSHAQPMPTAYNPDPDPHADPDSSPEPPGKLITRGNGRGPHAQTRSVRTLKPDEEYLRELQAKPVYANLNVVLIYGKMVEWCQVKGKQPTRARLVNWLNREDQPLGSGAVREKSTQERAEEIARKIDEGRML